MSKMTNQTARKSLDELKRSKEQEALDEETRLMAIKMEGLLKENSYALQTYIQPVMELGVIKSLEGRVRLIKMKNETPKNETEPTN